LSIASKVADKETGVGGVFTITMGGFLDSNSK